MDIIDKSILDNRKKGKSAAVIRRYIKMKYRINIDLKVLRKRIKQVENLRFRQPNFG